MSLAEYIMALTLYSVLDILLHSIIIIMQEHIWMFVDYLVEVCVTYC